MPISLTCPACGRRLKANDALAGRRLPCPACKADIEVPAAPPVEDAAAALLLSGDEPAATPARPPSPAPEPKPVPAPAVAHRGPVKPPTPAATLAPLKSAEPPVWLRHLHWLLMLALLPLAVSLLRKGDDADLLDRIDQTIEAAPPEVQDRYGRTLEAKAKSGDLDLDVLIGELPGGRVKGAALGRHSQWHWAMALGAAVLFLGFFVLLSSGGVADARHLLAVGLFTGTVGILFLLIVQALADWTQGRWVVGRSILVIFFWIAKLIGLSYRAALDPENGFWVSFLGFTAGVGLLEEVVKAVPVLWRYRREADDNWRGAFLWGLASGAGFGVAEGVIYSVNYYHGIVGPGTYIVRFVSCMALHALWTGSVAIAV
jgi:protease PrsW